MVGSRGTKLWETVKGLGITVFGVAALLLVCALILRGMAWLTERVLPWLLVAAIITAIVSFVILLPLSFFLACDKDIFGSLPATRLIRARDMDLVLWFRDCLQHLGMGRSDYRNLSGRGGRCARRYFGRVTKSGVVDCVRPRVVLRPHVRHAVLQHVFGREGRAAESAGAPNSSRRIRI